MISRGSHVDSPRHCRVQRRRFHRVGPRRRALPRPILVRPQKSQDGINGRLPGTLSLSLSLSHSRARARARAYCYRCLRLRIILMSRRSCRRRARFIGASRYAGIYARHVSHSASPPFLRRRKDIATGSSKPAPSASGCVATRIVISENVSIRDRM